VAALRIYTNENVHVAIADGLKLRGVDAWPARDCGNLGLSDEDQLEYAITQRAAVFTHDVDFLRLATDWVEQQREHRGIIFSPEHSHGIGEAVRQLAELALFLEAEDMANRVEFL